MRLRRRCQHSLQHFIELGRGFSLHASTTQPLESSDWMGGFNCAPPPRPTFRHPAAPASRTSMLPAFGSVLGLPNSVLLVLGWAGIPLVSLCPGIAVFDSFVAPAGRCHEPWVVENRDGAAPVGYDLAFPQGAHCHADAHAPDTQHERKKF